MAVYRLSNTIQEYPWGSTRAIPELLGIPADPRIPRAELWMGAHPKAPSRIALDGGKRSLLEAIDEAPQRMLGNAVARRFDGRLPFLFKILAAATSLSIQAHPSRLQAEEGFSREEAAGVPIDAPNRNYRDRNHKPEIVCALTGFDAMCGFRPVGQIRSELAAIGAPLLRSATAKIGVAPEPEALEHFLLTLLTATRRDRDLAIALALRRLSSRADEAAYWVRVLEEQHPRDIGALAPLFLNIVRLSPGQAMYLDAGVLHGYLEGTAVELMANSDNVLRGGLTGKHIDIDELAKVVRFESREPALLACERRGPGVCGYATPAEEFELSAVEPAHASSGTVTIAGGAPLILLCVEGSASVTADGATVDLGRGRSLFSAADTGSLEVSGECRLFCAGAPSPS